MVILVTKMNELPKCCEDCQLSHYHGGNLECGQVSTEFDNYINMIGRKQWTRHENCPLIEFEVPKELINVVKEYKTPIFDEALRKEKELFLKL